MQKKRRDLKEKKERQHIKTLLSKAGGASWEVRSKGRLKQRLKQRCLRRTRPKIHLSRDYNKEIAEQGLEQRDSWSGAGGKRHPSRGKEKRQPSRPRAKRCLSRGRFKTGGVFLVRDNTGKSFFIEGTVQICRTQLPTVLSNLLVT